MKFFAIEQPQVSSPEDRDGRSDAIKEEGNNVGDALHCPLCNRPLSMLKWLPPFRIELESWGKHYGDIACVGDDLIVSDRFKRAYSASGLRGLLCFEPVTIINVAHRRGKPKEPLPDYYKANVIRNSAVIDQEASGYVWDDKSKVCSECLFGKLKRYRRLIVKEDTWTGDDVFFPRGGRGPIVSERFKSFFFENVLHGVVFIPCESEEAGYDSYPWELEGSGQDNGTQRVD